MKVLHIHNEIENKGGTEVYLTHLQKFLPAYGCISYWLGIQKTSSKLHWAMYGSSWKETNMADFKMKLEEFIRMHDIKLICIHNLFDEDLIAFFISSRPVIKFSHSPVIVCPGRDKYWRYSNRPCTKPFGVHCFWHIYSEGCSNRNPKSVLHSWVFASSEINRSKNSYKRVVVMSNYNLELLQECGISKDKILVNPYFAIDSGVQEEYIQSESLRLLFIGRIVQGKGVMEMLSATEQILRHEPRAYLDIIGDGPMMGEVKQKIKQLGLETKIILKGWLPHDEVDKTLNDSYLVIFPSTYPESFGIVGIEAMMKAKPVVGFDVGGVSTWLKNGYNGFLLQPGDTAGMENAIKKLIKDTQLYQTMCSNGRELALQLFTPPTHISKLIELFSECVNKISLN